ncbi:ubinuclein-1-like isoform X1 [Varroa destructor]|uniref:Uncharacterized protein n=1 Tax=Varroa destructor TaxID=109461 RepID=A0A7M7K7W3_VARDE|nr:ubinuclein-1-like isoform X1 [Varroa destructor]
MSEPRRVSLQPAVDRLAERVGDPAGGGAVGSKPASSKRKKRLTMRFNLDLGDPNEDVCHEFNYIELVRNHKRCKPEPPEGDDPFEESDEDEVAAIARKMEEKYGSVKVAWDDDVDRGQGYDEDDSFIDNGEAYDEVVPLDLNTKHGGFYINSGELEFVHAPPLQYMHYHQQNEANKNKVTLEDSPPDEDSEQESERARSPKEEKQRSPLKVKRRRKRKRLDSDDSKDNRDQGLGEKEREDRRQKRKEKMLMLKKKIKRIESSSDEDADGDRSPDDAGQTDREKAVKDEIRDNLNRVDRDKDKEMKEKLLERMSVKQERQLDDAIESVVRKAREQNKKEVEEEELELLRQQEEEMEREERQKERRQNKERLERIEKERQQQQLTVPKDNKDTSNRDNKERLLLQREKDNNREARDRIQIHQKDREPEKDRERDQQRVVLQQQLQSQQQQQSQQQVSSQQQSQQQQRIDQPRDRGDSRDKERMMIEQKIDYSASVAGAANEFALHRLPDAAVRLPDRMPRDLEKMIADITAVARENLGKSKFFQANGVNETLLHIDRMARQSLPCSQRTQLYAYLTAHLPCSKETLLKRIKKLRLDEEDMKVKEPMARFKAELNHMVEEQLERYRRRCKEAGQTPCGVSDSEAEDNDVRVHRIFEWTDALRRLFREVVSLKLKTYEVSKLRATSAEDYVRNFFEIDMIILWPRGWMNVRTLLRMAREEQLFQRARSDSIGSAPRKLTQLQNFGGANGTPGVEVVPSAPHTPTTPLGALRANNSYSSIETPLKDSYKDAMQQLDVTPSSRSTTPGNTSVIREKGSSGANTRTPEDPPSGLRSHPLTPGLGTGTSSAASREHRDSGHSVLSVISDSPSVLVKEERVPSPAVSPPTSSAINDRCSPIGITSTPLAASAAAHSDSATTPVHMSVITSSPAKQQQPSQTASQLLPQVETPSFGDSFAPLIATTANVTTTGTNSANHASSATAQTPAPPKKQHSATPLLKANYQAALQKSPPFGTSGGALANASTGVGSSTSAVTSPSAAQAFAQFSQKVAAAAAAAAAAASNAGSISYPSSGTTHKSTQSSTTMASSGATHTAATNNSSSNNSGQYHQSKSATPTYQQQQHKYQQQQSGNNSQQQSTPQAGHQGANNGNNSHYGGSSHNNYYSGSSGQSGGQQQQQHGSGSGSLGGGGGSHSNHAGGAGTHTSNSGHQSTLPRDKEPLMASQVLDRIITQQLATNSYPSSGGNTLHLSSTGSSVTAAVFGSATTGGSGSNYPTTTSGGNSVGSYTLGGAASLMSPPSHRSSHQQSQQSQQQQHKSPQLPRASMPSSYNIYEALQQPHKNTSSSANNRSSNSSSGTNCSSQQQGMQVQQQQRSSSNLEGMKSFPSSMTSHSQAASPATTIPSYYTSSAAAAASAAVATSVYQNSTHQQSTSQQSQQLQRQAALNSSVPQVAHPTPVSQSGRYSWGSQTMYSTQQQQQQRHMYQDQQEKILYQQYTSQQGQDNTSQLHHNRQHH